MGTISKPALRGNAL